MRIPLLTGIVLASVTGAFAATTDQTPTTAQPAGLTNQTMTLVGCVGGGASAADPFMLSNISPGSVGTQTPGQVTTPGTMAPPAAATGATGSATSGATGSAAGVSPSPTTAGTAAATPSPTPATAGGYRLTGSDVSEFRGQRVQIVGSLSEPTWTSGSAARHQRSASRVPRPERAADDRHMPVALLRHRTPVW